MIAPMQRKIVGVTPPAAIVDNAAVTTTEIDTIGYAYAVINVYMGATDIAPTTLKVTESDTSGSGHADITASVFGTAVNDTGSASTLPSATDDNKIYSFFVDLRGRKRYLDLSLTGGDGTLGGYFCCWAELWRAQDAPLTAVQAGYAQRMVF